MRAEIDIDDYFPASVWLVPLLDAFTLINESYLRATPSCPEIYKAGVYYQADPAGRPERWWDIPRVLAAKHGDCKKLSCWRAAELRVRHGIDARALPVMQTAVNGVLLVHVIVQFPDGLTEDPSRILGMR
jgi:hypothetical protein